ncbi:hypothetical protein LTR37_017374 [Vermiconidia calcicola]|uniref:Uncharacterized protein n=1 Tax=Vermiconidia calcicola TaxID=1690605 RepID=A0ACC3MLS7_9PEZI|nr:hypothetical protein LTR37_017374 [Vermiconidia calcicola]
MTASIPGYQEQPHSPEYDSSKWGVRGLMRCLRRTMPGMCMRVIILAPRYIWTRIMTKEFQEMVAGRGLRFAETADAGAAVLHLASDESINRRACTIVTRNTAPQGFTDLLQDDIAEDDSLELWRDMVTHAPLKTGKQ